VEGSQGFVYDGLTANPAAWNVFVRGRTKTCRRCQPSTLADEEGAESVPYEPSTIRGRLVPDWDRSNGSSGILGRGCSSGSVTGLPAPPAPSMVLMVARGACSFEAKARAAAGRGFAGLLVVDFRADDAQLPDMAALGEADVPVPAWVVPSAEGETLRALAAEDPVVIVDVDDVVRKPRLGSAQSDSYGVRVYSFS